MRALHDLQAVVPLRLLLPPRQAIEGSTAEHKVTWNRLKAHMPETIYKLSTQKFQLPSDGEAACSAHFAALNEEISAAFRSLED